MKKIPNKNDGSQIWCSYYKEINELLITCLQWYADKKHMSIEKVAMTENGGVYCNATEDGQKARDILNQTKGDK